MTRTLRPTGSCGAEPGVEVDDEEEDVADDLLGAPALCDVVASNSALGAWLLCALASRLLLLLLLLLPPLLLLLLLFVLLLLAYPGAKDAMVCVALGCKCVCVCWKVANRSKSNTLARWHKRVWCHQLKSDNMHATNPLQRNFVLLQSPCHHHNISSAKLFELNPPPFAKGRLALRGGQPIE